MSKVLSIVFFLATASSSVSSAAQERTVEDYMAAIEGAQSEPGANGLGALTIEELMERFNVPGVSVAVIRDFDVHWAKGYGVADVETGEPVDTETMFQVASISKPVAAMGVLKAVQDGVFALDDDINEILTSLQLETGEFTRERPVTPRTLTSHTSGLGDAFGFPGYDPAGPIPTVIQILEGEPPSNTRPLFMERPPMSLMEYSGGGVTLMQQALADAREKPFEEILRDDVLLPIGMHNSTYENPLPPERDRNAARAHDRDGKSRGAKWHVYPEMAAAGLWTTAADLARFAIEVQKSAIGESNKVLSRSMVQEMLTPVGVGDFAVGFGIQKIGQGWYFRHDGGNWGFQADLVAHKVHGYGLSIMTNSDQGFAVMQELRQRVERAYEWDSVASPAPRGYDPPLELEAIELPPEVLDDYVGEYQLNAEVTLSITLENGALRWHHSLFGSAPLFATDIDHFFLRVAPVEVLFTRDGAGAVNGLTEVQGGQRQIAPKVR
jgi:CubicO group peptidase (beta-lactamase class C family)